jgi:hypothetical protein
MTEYLKAATVCDVTVARRSPLPIDAAEVRRQQVMHEKLVEQAVQTRLLLDGLERFPGIVQSAGAVVPRYAPPGALHTDVDPAERRKGPCALQRELEQRIAGVERDAAAALAAVIERERVERALGEKRRAVEASRDARRAAVDAEAVATEERRRADALNAAAAAVGRAETQLDPLAPGWARRRVHPVDVLHQRIAAEIRRELSEFDHRQATLFLSTRLRGAWDGTHRGA